MLLIVAHHYVVNSGLTAADGPIYADPMTWRSLFLLVFGAWGKTGINCFLMITGYYMCVSRITARKFAKLFCEVMFYHIVIGAAFLLSGAERFSLKACAEILIPVMDIGNGFTPAYLVFFLLIPYLNILIRNMSERQHVLLLLWCGFTYVFLGTVPKFSVTMNYVSWFSVIFLIAAYIRLYPKRIYERGKLWGFLTLAAVTADVLSIVCCAYLSGKTGRRLAYAFVEDSNTFLAVVTGVCAFLYFKNLKIPYNRFINAVAASTFGVLLIHANAFMRGWLWNAIDCTGCYGADYMPVYAFFAVLCIFSVCTAVDRLRIRFVEELFFRGWDSHEKRISEKLTYFFERMGKEQ